MGVDLWDSGHDSLRTLLHSLNMLYIPLISLDVTDADEGRPSLH